MTNWMQTGAGVALAALSMPQASDWVQLGGSLVGTGLLVWIIVRKERDCEALRRQNHELSRELVAKCGDCALARAANDTLVAAGKEHFKEGHDEGCD